MKMNCLANTFSDQKERRPEPPNHVYKQTFFQITDFCRKIQQVCTRIKTVIS